MLIIDKSNPTLPYKFVPVPTFGSDYDKDKWLDLEKKRWLEGYNGLTGLHYFALSQCKIKKGTGGSIIRPYFRDIDERIYHGIDKAQKDGFVYGVLKRREVGLTSIGAGILPIHTMLCYPGSNSIMTSCDKPRVFRMFEDKTATVFDSLHPLIKENFRQNNRDQSKNSVYLKAKIMVNEEGVSVPRYSDITCSETVTNPKAFSSQRVKYGFYDELPLHETRRELISSSNSCFMEGPVKTGFLLWGGTVEDGIPQDSLNDLRILVADSGKKESNTVIHFIAGWEGLFIDPKTGISDKQKGIDYIEKERDRLDKFEDKTEYKAWIKNYPLSIEEILDVSTDGALPKEVLEILSEQRKIIINTQPPIAQYDLKRNEKGIVNAYQNNKGKFTILSHPEGKVKYISGTDPIPFNDTNLADGSEYCIAIKDYDRDTYVAYYSERNLNADVVISNALLLQDYYNGAVTMLETNMGGVALEKYKEMGRYNMLANKPTALGIKFVDQRVTKGFYKNVKTSARLNEVLIKYLLAYGKNVWFMRMITELEVFLRDNTDLVDAMCVCEIYDTNTVNQEKKKQHTPQQYKEVMVVVRDSKGRTQWETKKIRLG